MSSTLPGIQGLLDKTLADLEVLLGVGGLTEISRGPLQHFSDSGLQSRMKNKTKQIFPFIILFSSSISLIWFKKKQTRKKEKSVCFSRRNIVESNQLINKGQSEVILVEN